jgi:hypothetical protein
MASTFPFVPLAESVAIAAVDGVLSSSDASAGRTTLQHSHASWWQAGVLAVGVLLEVTGKAKAYITEPMLFVPAALFAREQAFKFSQSGAATPIAAQPYRAAVAGNAAYARPLIATPYMAQQAGGLL